MLEFLCHLELAAASGEIELKYLDESGFCMWGSVNYTYFPRGQQKRLEQTQRRGRQLSIIGLLQQERQFYLRSSNWFVYEQVLYKNDGTRVYV
jgi:hypothetical protein